jgi:hypothetical protein
MNATVICQTEQYADATCLLLLLHQTPVVVRGMGAARALFLDRQQ